MTSSSSSRETIHISLGSTANCVSAHLCNLQGLGASSVENSIDSNITHSIHKETLVPRVLMVDLANEFQGTRSNNGSNSSTTQQPTSSTTPFDQPIEYHPSVATWQGSIVGDSSTATRDDSSSYLFAPLHDAAHTLAYSSHSRYHYSKVGSSNTADGLSFRSQNGRHVNWDDEEEDEEEEDEEYERTLRQERNRLRWQAETQPSLENQMDEFWKSFREKAEQSLEENKENPASTTLSSSNHERSQDQSPKWIDYFMPPYDARSLVPLPFDESRNVFLQSWDSYLAGSRAEEHREWKEDVLLERLRHQLERCDSVQGVSIMTEAHGLFAGLATSLLQELENESPSAGRLVYHLTDPATLGRPSDSETRSTSDSESLSSWHPTHVKLVRGGIENGCALFDLTHHAHAVLPVSFAQMLPSPAVTDGTTPNALQSLFKRFRITAQLAMALEVSTLAYRVNGNGSSIGLAGGHYGGAGFASAGYGTAPKLSFGEYLATVRPAERFSLLELDTSTMLSTTSDTPLTNDPSGLATAFVQGTSVERDHRMKHRNMRHRPRDVEAGSWLESKDSLLSSVSPLAMVQGRRRHQHFALTTSMRPYIQWDQYLTCAMEGMWTRYRPGVSMGLVASESFQGLTSIGYGAGSYWKSIVLEPSNEKQSVLGVVSNSTRSYAFLHSTASKMKSALQPKFRGYVNRDVLQDLLPDPEDCTEAMDSCWDLRDVYEPPDGGEDEEGVYFGDAV